MSRTDVDFSSMMYLLHGELELLFRSSLVNR